ncbi:MULTISPECIES: LysR family transcriptional regulator [unclassified Streptomyces]|uniref:helix-turn-helix domain-containing protein n=1 Tax=unclassified Streptomyces TaxID=2593676 RepID=UPI0037F91314
MSLCGKTPTLRIPHTPGIPRRSPTVSTYDKTTSRSVTGRLGRTRLELFAAAAPYGSLAKAAKALDVGNATLRAAIRQVEADLGLHLIERATPTTPMQLTDPGHRILAAIHAWQQGLQNV